MNASRYKQLIISITILVFLIQFGCADKTSSPPVKNVEIPEKQSDLPDYEQIKKRIADITAKHLGIESREINADSPLSRQKIAADELDVIEIIMNVEDAFSVEIKDFDIGADISNAVSVKKLADIVFEKKKQRK
jgi:acyl carrier protein